MLYISYHVCLFTALRTQPLLLATTTTKKNVSAVCFHPYRTAVNYLQLIGFVRELYLGFLLAAKLIGESLFKLLTPLPLLCPIRGGGDTYTLYLIWG
jgi:hypothetical protein